MLLYLTEQEAKNLQKLLKTNQFDATAQYENLSKVLLQRLHELL